MAVGKYMIGLVAPNWDDLDQIRLRSGQLLPGVWAMTTSA
jgi:hypothetical protein